MFIDGDKGHLHDAEDLKEYLDSAEKYSDYLPAIWKDITEAEKLGHGGKDYLMLKTFLNTIIENNKMPIDVYEGATWMSITAYLNNQFHKKVSS